MRHILLAVTLAAMVLPAGAHDSTGPNGGQMTDAGNLHVEVVTRAETVQVFLGDGAGKPLSTVGYKGLAILLVGDKVARIPLQPEGTNRLTGVAVAPFAAPIKGAIQITGPDGATVQASFK